LSNLQIHRSSVILRRQIASCPKEISEFVCALS
jgi:hypothetical protein